MLTENQVRVLDALKASTPLRLMDLVRSTHMSESAIALALHQLENAGHAKRAFDRRCWKLTSAGREAQRRARARLVELRTGAGEQLTLGELMVRDRQPGRDPFDMSGFNPGHVRAAIMGTDPQADADPVPARPPVPTLRLVGGREDREVRP